jgi:hypothetical protein
LSADVAILLGLPAAEIVAVLRIDEDYFDARSAVV